MQSPPPFGPALWSKVLHALLYTNQPRDEHSREHGIGLHRMSDASQKLFHFIEYSVLIADKRQMIVSRKLDKLRTRNPLRHKPAFFNFQTLIFTAMNHERRHSYRRQHVTHVDLSVHLRQRHGRPGTSAHSQVSGPPVAKLRIVRHTRRALVDPDWSTPLLPHHFEKLLALFERRSPRI